MNKIIIIKYGELTTKKDNINYFLKALKKNVEDKLVNIDHETTYDSSRMFIKTSEFAKAVSKLQSIFGIHKITIAYELSNDLTDIKDTSSASETCVDSLENFYQDDEYVYSFPCMKSSKIIVYYNDGTQDYVRNALSNKDITISDLDYYQINYVKEPISK